MNRTSPLPRGITRRPSQPALVRSARASAAAYVRRPMPAGVAADRGAMSLLFATVAVALALFMCFVADAGRAMHADSRADDLAQEAARAAGQQLDPAQAITGTAFVVDPDTARTAALDYLAARGMTGTVTFADGGATIEVTATSRYHTLFLGVVGVSTLPVTGHGTARLLTHAGG
jgi:Flp pilus assembly protein TadG